MFSNPWAVQPSRYPNCRWWRKRPALEHSRGTPRGGCLTKGCLTKGVSDRLRGKWNAFGKPLKGPSGEPRGPSGWKGSIFEGCLRRNAEIDLKAFKNIVNSIKIVTQGPICKGCPKQNAQNEISRKHFWRMSKAKCWNGPQGIGKHCR